MLARELKNYCWEYDNGFVTLIDKKNAVVFELPIAYMDSLMRAGIAFKNAHKNEQVVKAQKKVAQARFSLKLEKDKHKKYDRNTIRPSRTSSI